MIRNYMIVLSAAHLRFAWALSWTCCRVGSWNKSQRIVDEISGIFGVECVTCNSWLNFGVIRITIQIQEF